MTLNDFQVCDSLLLVYRYRHGLETRAAMVFDKNYNNNGLVTYIGRHSPVHMESGSGAFDPTKLGSKRYGLIAVEVVGRGRSSFKCRGPRPGDRGYDLMC